MTDIYSVLSDETLEKIAAGADPYKSMTDSELEAVAAIEEQQLAANPASLAIPASESHNAENPPIAGIGGSPASEPYNPNVVGGAVGEVQTLVTPEEAKAMPEMGAATKGALRVQEQGGPVAYDDDGSVVNWLGNLWNTIAYNSSGKVTSKSTNKHTQSILRGTVKKDGREVPLAQLDDDELDYLVDSAGWNGWKGWLGSFVGNRADDGIMQQWDRTTGTTIQDPVARKEARVKYAQDIARGMVEQQESERLAAGAELENRPKQFGADVGAGLVETASYMLPYLLPHTRGIMAGIVEAGDRTNELLNDVYYVDENGTIRVKAQRDSTGAALAKGAARGAIAPLVEKFGGEIGAGLVGAIAKNTLGRIPLVKAVSGKVVETAAGKAVSKWMNSMSRLGKYTGMQSMPVEMLEEFEDQVLDAGLGLNLREGEKKGTTGLSRAAGAAKEFFKPENLQELAESMVLIQVLGGGAAYMNDRRITKHLDSLIAKEAGITPEELSGYSLEDKQAAYQAFVEGLSEAEIARRFNRGAEAVNKLANAIRDGKENLTPTPNKGVTTNETRTDEAQPEPEQAPRVTPPTGEEARPVEAGEAPSEVGGEVAATQPTVEAPVSAPAEMQVNTPTTTTESAEGGSGATGDNADIPPAADDDLPPSDDSESEVLPSFENPEEADPEGGLVEEESEVLPTTELESEEVATTTTPELPTDPKPTTTNRLKNAAGIDPTAVPTKKTKVDKLLAFPDSLEKYGEMTGRLLRVLDKGGVSPDSPKGKRIKAELARMDEAGWGEVYKAQMDWAGSPKKTRGEQPPRTPAEFAEWKKTRVTATPIDNTTQNNYNNTQVSAPQEGLTNEGQQTQEASAEETQDEFRRLQEASRGMSEDERELYRRGSKVLDERDLGRADGGRGEGRRGRIVDVLRRRIAASNNGANLSGVKTLTAEEKDGTVLEKFKFGKVDGQTFRDVFEVARNYLKNGELVDLHDTYGDDVKCFLSEDGLCGFAVEADGNLVSVFSLRKGSLNAMKGMIKKAGATHLDAYASKNQDLARIYSKVLGFKVASRMDYNMDYDHDNIAANHGNPDVVFMYLPQTKRELPERRFNKDSFDEAVAYQKELRNSKFKPGAAKKSDAQKFYDLVARTVKEAKSIYDWVKSNDETAKLDPFKFRKGKGNQSGLELKQLQLLAESTDKNDYTELGLTDDQAEELVRVIREAYIEQDMASPNATGKVENEGRITYVVGAMRALDELRIKPNDIDAMANAMRRLSDASEAAFRKIEKSKGKLDKDIANENYNFWNGKYEWVLDKFNSLTPSEQNKVIKRIKAIQTEQDAADNKNTIRIDNGEKGSIDIADDESSEQVYDEVAREFGDELTNEVFEDAEPVESNIGNKTDVDNLSNENAKSGRSVAKVERGEHYTRVDKVDGDNITVTTTDLRGKNPHTMVLTRAQWEAAASLDMDKSENPDLDPKNPQVGDMVRLSQQINAESQEERDRRFAEDKNYQAWLKRQKANDADRMREKYEQESAKIAAGIGRNFIGGMKVKTVDREYIPSVDGNADERQSIGGIYTGTAADYANKDENGNIVNGPSLHYVGTGEGLQAYGWGLYGSNRRGVAETYANMSKADPTSPALRVKVDGKYLSPSEVSKLPMDMYKVIAAVSEAKGDMDAARKRLAKSKEGPFWKKSGAERLLESHSFEYAPQSSVLYEQTFFTNRAPGDESHLLKWYEPVSEENKKRIADQLNKEYGEKGFTWKWNGDSLDFVSDKFSHLSNRHKAGSAADLYARITTIVGGKPQAASEFLARADIDGIKYPVDSYGKTVKDGDKAGWNYVSFRDDNIRVDHKWMDGAQRYLRDPNTQKVVGTWNRKTNELTLFRGANASTLVHELGGHAAYQFAQEQAAQGDKTLLNKMNECINYALTNPKMKPLIEDIRSRYPEATEEVMRDEIFAALMERNSPIMQGLTKTLQGKAWYNRTWQAIKDAFRAMLTKMGFNKSDLRGIDKMQPEEFMSWLDRTMADGKNLGALAGMGLRDRNVRHSLHSDTIKTLADNLKKNAPQGGYNFTPFTKSVVMLLQSGGRVTKVLPGNNSGSVVIESPNGKTGGRNIDYSALKHNWETGRAYSGYYTWPEFNEAFKDENLKNITKFPDKTYKNQEVIQWRVNYPASENSPAYTLTWRMIRNTSTGKMINLFTDRERNEHPQGYNKAPEGEHFGTITPQSVAESSDPRDLDSSSGEDGGSITQPSVESNSDLRNATITTTATSFMDDKRSRSEILEEKLVDSIAPIKSVQTEIDNHARANGEEGVEEVVNADGSTDWRNSTDFVAAKDKENGHLERNIRELKTRYIDPAMEALAKAIRPNQDKADLITDFNLYLQCKHAAARNRKIANDRGDTYTPDYSEGMGMVTLPDGRRVGLSENVANQILATMERKYGAKFSNFKDAAQSVYDMLEADLYNRYQSGLISEEDYINYMDRRQGTMEWDTYIPLKDDLKNAVGEGYNAFSSGLKRNEFMRAKGRGSNDIANSPFAAAVLQAEQGIRRSSRNVLANVEANLAAKMNGGFAKNGMTDFSVTELTSQGEPVYAEVVAGVDARRTGTEFEFTFADGDRAVASAGASVVANRPDIHLFKRDGKLYAIRYPAGANGRGIAVANAFSGENMGNWGKGLGWIPTVTHWLSSMRTQYSPEFTVSNMLSDNLEALQALVGRYGLWDGGKAFGKALQYQWKNRKDLWHYVRTGEARGLVKNAIDAGILTKGGVASQGIDAETKELTADLDRFIRKQKRFSEMNATDMAKSFGRNVVDYISMANSFAEYSTRIGIASALGEYGVPRKDAIKFARDATVNFNRKGTAMPYINGLYMFANAAVQGAMRSVQSFRDDFSDSRNPTSGALGGNRKMKGELVGMLVAIGVAKAILDNALGDDDEREKEGGRNARNLSEYDRKHNVGLPIGGGRQIVPLRFRGPYAAIPYLAQTFTRFAMGEIDAGDVGAILASELGAQTTELIGGNGVTNDKGEYDESLFMQSVAPTVIDPFVQMATGKDYKGDDRLRKKFDENQPDSWNGKYYTPGVYKGIAQVLNYITGGNENRPGGVDFAPENIQLATEFILGAPLRDVNNLYSSVKNAAQWASGGTPEKPLSQIPFVRRFVREYPDVSARYRDAVDMYDRDKTEYKKTTRLEVRRDLRRDKPYLSASKTSLDKMIDRVKELTHLERGEVKRGRKWVEPKVERSEEQKEKFRRQRLKLQATILRRLGE